MRRADAYFHALWANDDDANRQAARTVLAGRYAWFEEHVLDPSGEGPMIPAAAKEQDRVETAVS